jgi:hypothetical protein
VALLWFALVVLISLWLYLSGRWLAARRPRGVVPAMLVSWLVLMVWLYLRQAPTAEAALLAWPGYIYVREVLYLPLTALFCGAAQKLIRERSARALKVLLLFLVLVAGYSYRWGLHWEEYRRLAGSRDRWGVLRSSSVETSGAAAAATLVYYYGVSVGEGWMARLTLTRPPTGPDIIGLCHGVRAALTGSDCRVTVRRPAWEQLTGERPPLLLQLRRDLARTDAVVLLAADAEGALLADPQRGVSYVDRETLTRLWTGLAVAVEPPWYLEPGFRRPTWVRAGRPSRPAGART